MSRKEKYREQNIVYGDPVKDKFVIVRDDNLVGSYNIVHSDYFYKEDKILFRIGHPKTDCPDDELMEKAKEVVDFLNQR